MTFSSAAISSLIKFASRLNSSVGHICLRLFPDAANLIVISLHGIVTSFSDNQVRDLNPRYVLTLNDLEQLMVYYLNRDYRPIGPADLLGPTLSPRGRFVMFTFDDGYANNLQVISLLEKYRVPAMFALVTDCVTQQETFWWDMVYKLRSRQGTKCAEIEMEVDAMAKETPASIDRQLTEKFGKLPTEIATDSNRPMRPEEIRELAKHPLVYWANHTARHEYLPSCEPNEVRLSVGRAQEALEKLTGTKPVCIVYPYGGHDARIRSICRDVGLRLGFTMASHKQSIPLDPLSDRAMAIPRFAVYHGTSLEDQCLETRVNWKPSYLLRGRVQ